MWERHPKDPDRQIILYVKFPSSGAYELHVFAKPADKEGTYDFALSYSIKAEPTADRGFPTTYGLASKAFDYFAIARPAPWKQGRLKMGCTVSKFQLVMRGGSSDSLGAESLRLCICGEWGDYLTRVRDGVWESPSPVKVVGKNQDKGVGVYLHDGASNTFQGLCKWAVQ
jgi:hypothetical protein